MVKFNNLTGIKEFLFTYIYKHVAMIQIKIWIIASTPEGPLFAPSSPPASHPG